MLEKEGEENKKERAGLEKDRLRGRRKSGRGEGRGWRLHWERWTLMVGGGLKATKVEVGSS